jgi:hypothetical protein
LTRKTNPTLLAALLVMIAAARALYLRLMVDMTGDEVWSVWQTLGSARDIVYWTPFDWPPGYYLIIGGWWRLTGMHTITLRYLMLLVFLLGAAGMYRAARRLAGGENAGLLALLAFGAFGWAVYGSIHLRGHSFTLSLSPLVLWAWLLYLARPGWRRALPVALLMAFMLYIHTTPVVYFVLLGGFTLVVYGWRAVLALWLPGVIAVALALPELVSKFQLATSSRLSGVVYAKAPLVPAMLDLYEGYFGRLHALWLALIAAAVAMLAWRWRTGGRRLLGLVLWALVPLALYVTYDWLALFYPRYVLWYLVGFALLLG